MKKLIVVLCLLFLPVQAFAESAEKDDRFYFSLSGMVTVAEDSTTRVDIPDTIETSIGEATYDAGGGLAVALGKKLGNGLRGEIEYSYKKVSASDFEFDTALILVAEVAGEDLVWDSSAAKVHTFMFNGIYDLENDSDITPYFGGGIGVGWVEDADGSEFAYQFLGGINYAVTEDTDLIFGYRYAGMTDVGWTVDETHYSTSVASHNFELGVRLAF